MGGRNFVPNFSCEKCCVDHSLLRMKHLNCFLVEKTFGLIKFSNCLCEIFEIIEFIGNNFVYNAHINKQVCLFCVMTNVRSTTLTAKRRQHLLLKCVRMSRMYCVCVHQAMSAVTARRYYRSAQFGGCI